jgi:1,4-dihydroxy-2-naphthoyl-CoA hydrolase
MEMPPLAGTLLERLGIVIVSAEPNRVVATMPVEGNTQPFGFLHGGATAALCESVASVGALLAADSQRTPFAIEVNINHLRSVREGTIEAIATPLHAGGTTAVWDVRANDDEGHLIAASRVTLVIRDRG